MVTTVLIVEDDPGVQELLRFTLIEAGFAVQQCYSAEEATDSLRSILPDLVLIDWMLVGVSGLTLAQCIRSEPRMKNLPIIMLTARALEADRVAGLEKGADDYITKPFSPRELIARIRALLRRRTPEQAGVPLETGPLQMDPVNYTVTLAGQPVSLSITEFRLLRLFMAYPERVFSRAQLLDKVWGDHVFIEERTIDVHIRRLRLALGAEGEQLIETVRGVGYKLSLPAATTLP